MLKHCAILSLFPELFVPHLTHGVTSRVPFKTSLHNVRDFGLGKHRAVDDRPFGGGPGMLMQAEPLLGALEQAQAAMSSLTAQTMVVYMSPRGEQFDRDMSLELASTEKLIIVCGRYEGVDQRFLDIAIDRHISIGPYVLSGGELPALVVTDAIARRLPGVLGNHESAELETFEVSCACGKTKQSPVDEGQLATTTGSDLTGFEHDQFTRPQVFAQSLVERLYTQRNHTLRDRFASKWNELNEDQRSDFKRLCEVPDVLLSGDHQKIAQWRGLQ